MSQNRPENKGRSASGSENRPKSKQENGPENNEPENTVAQKIEQLVEGPLTHLGLQLLDVDYRQEGGWVVRLVIDQPQGVTLEDCQAASRLAETLLDEADPVPHEFRLEVTSPGLFRPLTRPRHFQQSVGRTIRLTLGEGIFPERKQRLVRGALEQAGEETLLLVLEDGQRLEIPYGGARKARLDPDLTKDFKSSGK
ncbi:MAG: ribosome maturation factor RimP [Deltaproteobacteria bacterium]|nr:ribosome maturation factor RimP [Deltaproteobacteria bacterium]